MSEPTDLTAAQLGALLAAKTRRVRGSCLQCGSDMAEVTVRRAFCSNRCRQRHWRQRQKGLGSGEPMPLVTAHRIAPTGAASAP